MAEVYKRPGSPYWVADYTVGNKRYRKSTRRTNKKEGDHDTERVIRYFPNLFVNSISNISGS